MKEVDLSELVKVTVERTRPSLDSSKVKLEFQPSKNETRVMAASEQIQQVILNLIQNSVKALEGRTDGLIQVSVETHTGEISAVVSDNGRGIKKENIDKLFIPFFTTSPSGTGLGLSISQKIVEAHRGRIEVATEEGRFARFSIVLPHAKQESMSDSSKEG
jgi:signal transduction histidine kinase